MRNLMKKIFITILFVFGYSSFADELKCSANGTKILHIPGAFTSGKDQRIVKVELNDRILFANPNKFDLKKQDADVIPIASQGYIQDKFNYIFNSYGDSGEFAWVALGATEYGFRMAGNIKAVNSAGTIYSAFATSGAKGVVGNAKAINDSGILGLFRAQVSLSGQGVKAVNSTNSDKPLMYTLAKGSTGIGFVNKLLLFSGAASMSNIAGWGLTAKNVLNMASLYALEGDFNNAINQDQDTALAAYLSSKESERIDCKKEIVKKAVTVKNKCVDYFCE